MVDLQHFEALFKGPRGFVGIARADFGGQEDAVATALERLADALFGEMALAVLVGRVDVSDAEVERFGESFQGGVLLLVLEEAAAAAEGQDGHARAALAEHASGQRGRAGEGTRGEAGDGRSAEEFTSGNAHKD